MSVTLTLSEAFKAAVEANRLGLDLTDPHDPQVDPSWNYRLPEEYQDEPRGRHEVSQ